MNYSDKRKLELEKLQRRLRRDPRLWTDDRFTKLIEKCKTKIDRQPVDPRWLKTYYL